MRHINQRVSLTLTAGFSTSVFARDDAYHAGYDLGRQVGRFVNLYLPHLGVALIIIAVGVVSWLFVSRRNK